MPIMANCACGAPATSGSARGECGSCFRRRLGSITLDHEVTASRTHASYYDREAITSQFGDDARERMMDATKGLGPGIGGRMRIDQASGQPVPITDREMNDVYLAGPEVADVV